MCEDAVLDGREFELGGGAVVETLLHAASGWRAFGERDVIDLRFSARSTTHPFAAIGGDRKNSRSRRQLRPLGVLG